MLVNGLSSSSLMAGVKGVFGDPAVQLHHGLRPGDDVTGHVTTTWRQAIDVVRCENMRPHLDIRDFTNKRLRCVKTTTQCVLGEMRRFRNIILATPNRFSFTSWECLALLWLLTILYFDLMNATLLTYSFKQYMTFLVKKKYALAKSSYYGSMNWM